MAHWTQKREAEKRVAAQREIGLTTGIQDLVNYLMSDKFHKDTTVQVGDVLLRIEEAKRLADQYERDQSETEAKAGNL